MVLLAGVAVWSLGTLVAPPAARLSLLALCASRVLVGLGEGLAPSSATNVMSYTGVSPSPRVLPLSPAVGAPFAPYPQIVHPYSAFRYVEFNFFSARNVMSSLIPE